MRLFFDSDRKKSLPESRRLAASPHLARPCVILIYLNHPLDSLLHSSGLFLCLVCIQLQYPGIFSLRYSGSGHRSLSSLRGGSTGGSRRALAGADLRRRVLDRVASLLLPPGGLGELGVAPGSGVAQGAAALALAGAAELLRQVLGGDLGK